MIDAEVTSSKKTVRILANILDSMWIENSNNAFIPTIKIKNKETNKQKLVKPYLWYLEEKKEVVNLFIQTSSVATDEDLTNSSASTNGGCVQFGTNDFPYGLYELTVHYNQNNSANNSSDFYKVFFEHLLVSPSTDNDKEIKWTSYISTKDSNPNETYITI